jgi:hypothetical protein
MLPKSVAPRFVWFATFPLSLLLWVVLSPWLDALAKFLALRIEGLFNLGFVFLSHYLIRRALGYLGIPVRSRSVERFQESDRDEEEVAEDLPIHIRTIQWPIWVVSPLLILAGFVVLLIPLWIPHPVHDSATLAVIMGPALIIAGLLATRARRRTICELNDKGIRVPDGFWGRLRFTPWQELDRFEIIHDDENSLLSDDYVLWDKAGRRRFQAFIQRLLWMKRSDRARIVRALRARFPEKGKADSPAEPVLTASALSAVWDRELDG